MAKNRIAIAGQEISLRQARKSDFEFVLALYLESTKPLLIALGDREEVGIGDRFKASYRAQRARVISVGADVIGWMEVSRSAQAFHLHQLHLVKEYRNKGIGTRLIGSLMDTARAERCPVTLNVIKGNPAQSLYLRLGFRVIGEDDTRLHMGWKPE